MRILILALAACGAFGQTPGAVKLENTQSRVVEVNLEPHKSLRQKDPHNRVLVFVDSGELKEIGEVKAGDARWVVADSPMTFENVSDHSIRIMEIEVLNNHPGPMPQTKLDPVLVDPHHYSVLFENPQVRVLRVAYPAHEKGERHEHILNRVVCYITEHPDIQAGGVRMAGASVHVEENPMDHPVLRIAVELK